MGPVAVGIALLLFVAFGALQAFATACYVTALGLFLLRGGFAFALVLISLLGPDDSEP